MENLFVRGAGHESENQLELYALDRLSDTEVIRVEEHLMVCEACRLQLEQTAAFALAMRQVLSDEPMGITKTRTNSGWFEHVKQKFPLPGLLTRRFALAGGLAAALVAFGLYGVDGNPFGKGAEVASLASLQLTASRGEMQAVTPSRELDLTLTDAPASDTPFRFEVVTETGSPVWKGTPQKNTNGLEAKVATPLSPGTYFGRLYSPSGKLLHEYGFRIRQ